MDQSKNVQKSKDINMDKNAISKEKQISEQSTQDKSNIKENSSASIIKKEDSSVKKGKDKSKKIKMDSKEKEVKSKWQRKDLVEDKKAEVDKIDPLHDSLSEFLKLRKNRNTFKLKNVATQQYLHCWIQRYYQTYSISSNFDQEFAVDTRKKVESNWRTLVQKDIENLFKTIKKIVLKKQL